MTEPKKSSKKSESEKKKITESEKNSDNDVTLSKDTKFARRLNQIKDLDHMTRNLSSFNKFDKLFLNQVNSVQNLLGTNYQKLFTPAGLVQSNQRWLLSATKQFQDNTLIHQKGLISATKQFQDISLMRQSKLFEDRLAATHAFRNSLEKHTLPNLSGLIGTKSLFKEKLFFKEASQLKGLLGSANTLRDNYFNKEVASMGRFIKNPINKGVKDMDIEAFEEKIKMRYQIDKLQDEYSKLLKDFESQAENKEQVDTLKQQLLDKEKIIQEQMSVLSLSNRVNSQGSKLITEDQNFRQLFFNSDSQQIVVISIDIRKSTELMLKAKSPQIYSTFITSLSEKLRKIVTDNFGVFDKFTGDGILAFFPEFYSGDDSLLRAIQVAEECHACFLEHYNSNRNTFTLFMKNIGLGIGVDCGPANLTEINQEITVVGQPVVYACRLSSAPANTTLLNQSAFDELHLKHPDNFTYTEYDLDIKNEDVAITYNVSVDWSNIKLTSPSWIVKE